jgi:hypothetical protein
VLPSNAFHTSRSSLTKAQTIKDTMATMTSSIQQQEQHNKIEEDVPPVARLWLKAYRATPKVTLPLSTNGLDIGFMLVCTCLFLITRQQSLDFLYDFFDWPRASLVTNLASGCIVGGIFHTPFLVPISYVLLRAAPGPFSPSASAKDYPRWWRDVTDAMLQFCSAYFIADMVHDFVFKWHQNLDLITNYDDLMFLCHHIVSLLYMTSSRSLGAGQPSLLMLIFVGEITNPLYNFNLIGQLATQTFPTTLSPLAQQLAVVAEIACAVAYIPFRAVIGPASGIYMTYHLLTDAAGKTRVPLAWRLFWILIMWIVALASVPYIFSFAATLKGHFMGATTAGMDQHQEL